VRGKEANFEPAPWDLSGAKHVFGVSLNTLVRLWPAPFGSASARRASRRDRLEVGHFGDGIVDIVTNTAIFSLPGRKDNRRHSP
jgi:hypothetical protein